ncbi:MAG: peptidylprolyl isomerase [Cellvibrio sp. 79]|nr:MAG: peptidylprolyl isomerase [Cellvibrio sp. 79]
MIRHFFSSLLIMCLLACQNVQAAEQLLVAVKTDKGTFVIELYPDKAPVTVQNFLAYVDSKFYDDTIFHRVVPGVVVQGGGMSEDYREKRTKRPIKNESDNGLLNKYKTVAMARFSNPDSATSQFFINLKNNEGFDSTKTTPGYAVFGRIVAGMEVVEKISRAPLGAYRAFPEAPNEVIRILSATRTNSIAVDNTAPTHKSSPFKDSLVPVNENNQ